jgi:hypothetical protein
MVTAIKTAMGISLKQIVPRYEKNSIIPHYN